MEALAALGVLVAGALMGFLLALVFCVPAWLLWNWLMPVVFGLPTLTLVQAWGLVLLCGILFKSHVTKSKD